MMRLASEPCFYSKQKEKVTDKGEGNMGNGIPSMKSGGKTHFWLNGYVKKQNCRIWSEANSQVYVETPLHPEKLTVWCALWSGGILLQKR
ncbi:hypothetical protein TNCV_1464371 [Trichonephila clavipes]|nr:hypothetical protein TNCV_1464371 [Trichonephila clavipes]